jgi:hypothetical protein
VLADGILINPNFHRVESGDGRLSVSARLKTNCPRDFDEALTIEWAWDLLPTGNM